MSQMELIKQHTNDFSTRQSNNLRMICFQMIPVFFLVNLQTIPEELIQNPVK